MTCGEFALVMAIAPLRYVTQCSCGAIHLQWDDWSLQVMPQEFRAFVRALNRRHELDGPNETPFVTERENTTLFALSLEQNKRYRIWYGGCALELDADELALMHGMLHATIDNLNFEPRVHPQMAHALGLN
jgi:hypothetical protein